jgi:hypothetical protein
MTTYSSEEILCLAIKTELQKRQILDASINRLRQELKRVRSLSAELEAKEKSLLLRNEPIFLPSRTASEDDQLREQF